MIFVLLFAMTTTASDSEPLYAWSIKICEAGVGCVPETANTCYPGWEKIFDEDNCKAALQAYKDGNLLNPNDIRVSPCNPHTMTYLGKSSYSTVPNGCFWNAGGCTAFQLNSGGNDKATNYPVLCKRSPTPCEPRTPLPNEDPCYLITDDRMKCLTSKDSRVGQYHGDDCVWFPSADLTYSSHVCQPRSWADEWGYTDLYEDCAIAPAHQACEEGISFSETGDDSAGDCQPCTSCSTTETAACTVTSDAQCAAPCEEGISFSETGDDFTGDCQQCTSCSTTETAACTVTSDAQCATPCEEGASFSETGDDAGEGCQSCNPCSDYGVSEMCTLTSDTVCLTCDDVLESMNSQIESLQTQYADAQAAFDANMKAMYETKYNQINPFDVLNEPVNAAFLALSVVGLISIGYIAGNRKSNNWTPIPEV